MHILLVDDKLAIREKITQYLKPYNFTITEAVNGLDALEKAQKGAFDLFIIDHLMPVMNGIQLVKNLKLRDSTNETPILFMTTQGLSTINSIEEYKYFDASVAKPIDHNIFIDVINQLFPKNSIRQSL